MDARETAAYAKGASAFAAGKMLPTSYSGSIARAFRMGKNEAAAKAGTITATGVAWLKLDREFFS